MSILIQYMIKRYYKRAEKALEIRRTLESNDVGGREYLVEKYKKYKARADALHRDLGYAKALKKYWWL